MSRLWNPEAAARAYAAALLCFKDSSASNLNFPSTNSSSHY